MKFKDAILLLVLVVIIGSIFAVDEYIEPKEISNTQYTRGERTFKIVETPIEEPTKEKEDITDLNRTDIRYVYSLEGYNDCISYNLPYVIVNKDLRSLLPEEDWTNLD